MATPEQPKLDDAARRQLARHASQRNLETKGTLATLKKEDKKKPALAAWKHSLAGAIAGCAEVAGTMPLDVRRSPRGVVLTNARGQVAKTQVRFCRCGMRGSKGLTPPYSNRRCKCTRASIQARLTA